MNRFKQRELALFLLFLLGCGLYLIPIEDIAFNSPELILGIPSSILAIFGAQLFLVLLIIIFSKIHFLPWAKEQDKEQES